MRIKSLAQGENILMLGIEPSTFVSKIEVLTTTPIVHEGAVVLDILEVIKFCRVQNKPLIIGTTAEEMFVIKATNENISTTDIIITLLATRTKDIIPILFQYPPSLSPHDANMVSKMATDVLSTCATRNVSQTLALQGRHYLWVYVWDHPFRSSTLWGAYHRSGKNVCHGTDIAFLLHFSHHGTKTFDNSSDDNSLSCQMVKLWTAFIWTGNPGKIGRGRLEKNGFITAPIWTSGFIKNPLWFQHPQDINNFFCQSAIHWPPYLYNLCRPVLVFRSQSINVTKDVKKKFFSGIRLDVLKHVFLSKINKQCDCITIASTS